MQGNPNPSHATRFQKGNKGNPKGKTSGQRRAEIKSAETAAYIQNAMLNALKDYVDEDAKAALESIKADPLRLIKDAMDRAHGQAMQNINATVNTMESAERKMSDIMDSIRARSGEPDE